MTMRADIPPVETDFRLKSIDTGEKNYDRRWFKDRVEEREMFHRDNLKRDQLEVYNYVHQNPSDIVVVQGYPGSGKTFTLRTIVHSWEDPVNVIIYKTELVNDFKGIAECHTMTKFFMNVFNMDYETYKDFEGQVTGDLNNAEFLMVVANLIAEADLPDIQGSLVIFDEFTVMPKPLLLVTLMLLKHYKIGAILCGDKLQLGNEKSAIMKHCTSNDIASFFADKSFQLSVSTNSEYNKIIGYVRGLASEYWIDDFARSMVAAVFPKQLLGSTKFADTHLAGSNKELKELADHLVRQEGHPCHPYMFMKNEGGIESCHSTEKFLEYLPLVKGSTYYVGEQSENKKAVLVSVSEDLDRVVLRFKNGDLIAEYPNTRDKAIQVDHRLGMIGGRSGDIFNFPIYPANFLTAFSCQGRQISGPLDITFGMMTYSTVYAAVSRVQEASQVVRVSMENANSHLISSIINFEEMVDPDFVMTADLLKTRMINYKFYKISESSPVTAFLHTFFASSGKDKRQIIRDYFVSYLKESSEPRVLNPPKVGGDWTKSPIHEILKYTDYLLGLACMQKEDRGIWLYEFLARSPALESLTQTIEEKYGNENSILYKMTGLKYLPDWQCDMMEFLSDKYLNKTRFGKLVYNMYKKGRDSEITQEWLVAYLNKVIREHKVKRGLNEEEEIEEEEEDSDGEADLSLASSSSMNTPTYRKRASQEVQDCNNSIKKMKKN